LKNSILLLQFTNRLALRLPHVTQIHLTVKVGFVEAVKLENAGLKIRSPTLTIRKNQN